MGDAGESELTAKAREVLARLNADDRYVISQCAAGLTVNPRDGERETGGRWHQSIQRCRSLELVQQVRWAPTDLGREVARLLSEVQVVICNVCGGAALLPVCVKCAMTMTDDDLEMALDRCAGDGAK